MPVAVEEQSPPARGLAGAGSLRLDVRSLDEACPQYELGVDVFGELRRILRWPDFEPGGGALLLNVRVGESALISVDSLSTISVGSPANLKMPFHGARSKPGNRPAPGARSEESANPGPASW